MAVLADQDIVARRAVILIFLFGRASSLLDSPKLDLDLIFSQMLLDLVASP